MPVSLGRCFSNCVNASRPPADAPIPTIGKGLYPSRSSNPTFDCCGELGRASDSGLSPGYNPRPVSLRRRAKKDIDRRPVPVLLGAANDPNKVSSYQQMVVWWSYIDVSDLKRFLISGRPYGKWAVTTDDTGQQTWPSRGCMDDNKNRGAKSAGRLEMNSRGWSAPADPPTTIISRLRPFCCMPTADTNAVPNVLIRKP
jgi:hypothetical protein